MEGMQTVQKTIRGMELSGKYSSFVVYEILKSGHHYYGHQRAAKSGRSNGV